MVFNVWTVLLIASASQCILLITYLLNNRTGNVISRILLLSILAIIFLISISNVITSSYLYRALPEIAGFARGMVFLVGPLLYFYVLSVTTERFRFKIIPLIHLIPYLCALTMAQVQKFHAPRSGFIGSIDQLMANGVQLDLVSKAWFAAYALHLSGYLAISIWHINRIEIKETEFKIPIAERLNWLKYIIGHLALSTLLFIGIGLYAFYTNTYTIAGNFAYTLILGSLVYTIGYQAMKDIRILFPGFDLKYPSGLLSLEKKKELSQQIVQLFESDRIHTDPDLKVSSIANLLQAPSHVVSRVIHAELGESFHSLVNGYRISEFKSRLLHRESDKYSIFGLAIDVGFKSKSTFNTAFKKETGMTPTEYIKTIR